MFCHAHRSYNCYDCRSRGFRMGNGFSSTIADIEAMELQMDAVQDIMQGDFVDAAVDMMEAEVIEETFGDW